MTTPLWSLRRLYALDDVLIEELAGVLGGHGRGASGDWRKGTRGHAWPHRENAWPSRTRQGCLRSVSVEGLAPVWCSVLLSIHRGGRQNSKAVQQIGVRAREV